MKKLLLVLLILSIGMYIHAQNMSEKLAITGTPYKLYKPQNIGVKEGTNSFSAKSFKSKLDKANVTYGSLHSYFIKSSVNLYTLLVEESTCLTANQDINTIMFTCRDDHFTDADNIPCNIISSYRVNPDTIWTRRNMTLTATLGDRYPSGVIYNPTGNTTANQAYSVVTGPYTDGTNWVGNYFASGRLDSSNFNVQNVSKGTYMQDMVRYGLSACDDGKIHVLGLDSLKADTTKFQCAVMSNGTFNSGTNSFNWSHAKIRPSVYNGNVNVNNFSTAWSQDGNTGYVYFFGVDSANKPNSFYPIVFESTDKGATWFQYDYFDFSTLSEITSRILPIRYQNNDVTLPVIIGNEATAVVDSTGNLHIFTVIMGSFYNNIDSLGYIYVTTKITDPLDATVKPLLEQKIFDLYTKDDGTWGAQYVDYLRSQTATAADATNDYIETGTSAVGWDHRLQASRTTGGGKIFLTWTDTDTSGTGFVADVNPNLIVYGKDIKTGLRAEKNFTLNTPYFNSIMLFHYAGNITLINGGKYQVPITFATINPTGDPGSLINNYFLDGISFIESDFVDNLNVKDITDKSLISVSQNYPNPFKGSTSISYYLPGSYTVSLEVRNLLGQKVFEMPSSNETSGSHTILINNINLQPGIYFYTFKANDFSVSKKMVVR